MEKIRKKVVELIVKSDDQANKMAKDNEVMCNYLNSALSNTKERLYKSSSYEAAQVINYLDHWGTDNKIDPVYEHYEQGEIIYIDFGAMNFGYEISYPHPAVVLKETGAFIFVAPCSTKKYGKGHKDIMDGEIKDGFEHATGIIIDNAKWLSKGRIIGRIGKVSNSFFKKLQYKVINEMIN